MTVTVLTADLLLTHAPGAPIQRDSGIAVENGAIVATGSREALGTRFPDAPQRHGRHRLLMPGLVNAHCHSGLLRGTAERLPVWEWLTMHINPMHRVLTAEDARAASWLAYAEALLSGTTTLLDMWRFMAGSAAVAEEIGIRLVAAPYVAAHPDYDYFDTLDMNAALLAKRHGSAGGRITVWVGLEHPFYADAAGHARASAMARDHATGLHTHMSEAEIEVAEFVRRTGKRPLFALQEMGLLSGTPTLIAHAVWLDDDEIALAADCGVAIAHNPVSNLKLASGIAPVAQMLGAGLAVGLGTDGEKENNNLDMFEEMKVASLVGKLRAMDASAMDAPDVLSLATSGGAKALGLETSVGSLEEGKRADAILVRTDTPRMTPLVTDGPHANVLANLVHAVRGSDVDTVMVDGEIVVDDGALVTADLSEIMAEVNRLSPGLFARRAEWLAANRSRQWTDAEAP